MPKSAVFWQSRAASAPRVAVAVASRSADFEARPTTCRPRPKPTLTRRSASYEADSFSRHSQTHSQIVDCRNKLIYSLLRKIGRAHVCTPVTNAHLVCLPQLEKKQHTS